MTDAELAEAQTAGVGPAQVTEVLGHVALNVLANYLNHVAEPELDFPRVPVADAVGAV